MNLEPINDNGASSVVTPFMVIGAMPMLARTIRALDAAFPPDARLEDAEANAITDAIHSVIDRLLAMPAKTAADVEAKLVAWTHLIEGECIMDVERWRETVAEVSSLLRGLRQAS